MVSTEEQWNDIYNDSCKLYKEIVEHLYSRTIGQANDKEFAKAYFLQHLEAEIDFQKGYPFNGRVIEYFQLFHNLGFSWKKFFKEVRVLQKIFTYDATNVSINDYAKLCHEFSHQEVKQIILESKMNSTNKIASIYDIMDCPLLHKNRDIDFIKYVAKYKTLIDHMQLLRNKNEHDNVNHTNLMSIPSERIRWNTGKGKKIELIRLLVALNDCKYFETSNGTAPSQEQLMNYFGEILSVNLKHFEQDLSNGFESKKQTNTAVFDKIKSAIEKRYYQKVEQN